MRIISIANFEIDDEHGLAYMNKCDYIRRTRTHRLYWSAHGKPAQAEVADPRALSIVFVIHASLKGCEFAAIENEGHSFAKPTAVNCHVGFSSDIEQAACS